MRKIQKKSENEPASLNKFKIKNPKACYDDLDKLNRYDIRQDIREACTKEQFYLCAYCCQRINGTQEDTVNEHVEAQKLAPRLTLDFNNLVASCKTPKQCDEAHKSDALPLTPLMPQCEEEFKFYLSGTVKGLTDRAKTSIGVLGLNNPALQNKRKELFNKLQRQTALEDGAVTETIKDLEEIKDGKLEPYAPVLVRMLQEYLKK